MGRHALRTGDLVTHNASCSPGITLWSSPPNDVLSKWDERRFIMARLYMGVVLCMVHVRDGVDKVSVLWSRAPRTNFSRFGVLRSIKDLVSVKAADKQFEAELNAGVTEMTLKAVQQRDPDVIDFTVSVGNNRHRFEFKRHSTDKQRLDKFKNFTILSD